MFMHVKIGFYHCLFVVLYLQMRTDRVLFAFFRVFVIVLQCILSVFIECNVYYF
jgi:hypothetical protein